jgi:putative membrane protein
MTLASGAGVLVLAALVVSGFAPYDRATWLLEVAPLLIALPILVATYRRFPLSDMLYVLIALHALALILGGAYTHARVPLGSRLRDWLHLGRNPYDRIGHLMQGFVPALVAREILLRGGHLGTQGDPWDTQWDMFMALIGSLVAMLGFARLHDARMAAVKYHGPGMTAARE